MTHAELVALLHECREVLTQALACTDGCGDPDRECPMQDAHKPYAYPQLIARLRTAADALAGVARDTERLANGATEIVERLAFVGDSVLLPAHPAWADLHWRAKKFIAVNTVTIDAARAAGEG